MNNLDFSNALQQIDIAQNYINELAIQINSVQEGLYKLQNEIEVKLKNVKKPRKPRTTLNSYKRYDLNIPYSLKDKYKELYGDIIQYDGNNWFYMGQLSKMPITLKHIRV